MLVFLLSLVLGSEDRHVATFLLLLQFQIVRIHSSWDRSLSLRVVEFRDARLGAEAQHQGLSVHSPLEGAPINPGMCLVAGCLCCLHSPKIFRALTRNWSPVFKTQLLRAWLDGTLHWTCTRAASKVAVRWRNRQAFMHG